MKLWKALLVLCLAFVTAGALYISVLVRRGFSARENPSWAESLAAGIARRLAMPATFRMKNPYPSTPENLSKASAEFAKNCAVCHGDNGNGETLIGQGLYPKPPDMRATETQNKSDGELFYTILNGVRLSGMPAFGRSNRGGTAGFSDEEAWKLVLFIRHLPEMTPAEEHSMQELNAKPEPDRTAPSHK